jgi:hypothetical protein
MVSEYEFVVSGGGGVGGGGGRGGIGLSDFLFMVRVKSVKVCRSHMK